MKAIARKDIVSMNGNIIVEKGIKYEVEKIIRPSYFGKLTGSYYPEATEGYKYNGAIYTCDVFEPLTK